jgi:hypothetical protein
MPSSKDASAQGANAVGAAEKKGDATLPGGDEEIKNCNGRIGGVRLQAGRPPFLMDENWDKHSPKYVTRSTYS